MRIFEVNNMARGNRFMEYSHLDAKSSDENMDSSDPFLTDANNGLDHHTNIEMLDNVFLVEDHFEHPAVSAHKRKLLETDFQSVESLHGLDISDSDSVTDSSTNDSDKPICIHAWTSGKHHQKKLQKVVFDCAHKAVNTLSSSHSSTRQRSISVTQAPKDLIQPKKLPVVFKWHNKSNKNVFVSGSWDNWKMKSSMAKSDDTFYTIIELPIGTHQYKFYVDGQWTCDVNEHKVDNSMGAENNEVTVKSSDFEVFEALDMDGKITSSSKGGLVASVSDEFGQVIPPRGSNFGFHSGPPILPPQLLQVILNKEISAHCEPTLLPEPNHVMLNHLYALSIKDGVMVLSTTHRYRKKYVTTLLYKPIDQPSSTS